jgi:hypothetical protein
MRSGSNGCRVRYVMFLVIASIFVLLRSQLLAANLDWCTNSCDPFADCGTECLVPSEPAFQTTCGEYDGGASNDWCWEGSCGDDTCDMIRGERCWNCSEDCGACPDPPSAAPTVAKWEKTADIVRTTVDTRLYHQPTTMITVATMRIRRTRIASNSGTARTIPSARVCGSEILMGIRA